MAIGYTYTEILGFPDLSVGQEIETIYSRALPEIEDDTLHTIIRFLGESEHPDYLKYHVVHEVIRRIKARWLNKTRDSIIEQLEFNLYRSKEGERCFITSGISNSNEMLRRLGESHPTLSWSNRVVDLKRLKAELGIVIKGAWFTGLKIADVSSVGIFGPRVADADDYDRYDQSGTTSSLYAEFELADGESETVTITRTGTVVVYSTWPEGTGLQLVEYINDRIAPLCQLVPVGKEPKRRPRG